jgi:hypothetical protein
MSKKPTCKTGLKKNVVKKAIFEREIQLCRQLSEENKGKCEWGKCRDCGVVPLLWKLNKGELLMDKKGISVIKKKLLKDKCLKVN